MEAYSTLFIEILIVHFPKRYMKKYYDCTHKKGRPSKKLTLLSWTLQQKSGYDSFLWHTGLGLGFFQSPKSSMLESPRVFQSLSEFSRVYQNV